MHIFEAVDQTVILVVLGGVFLLGLGADLAGRFTFLPRVTLLLLCGVAAGPSGLALLPEPLLAAWFPALTTIALALIGFLLGEQLSVATLRKRGKTVVSISLCKAVGAAVTVALALWLVGLSVEVALLLGGIATATAPAASYDVVHENGARGEFADTLLAVVALDDVWGLLIFVLMMSTAAVFNGDATISSGLWTSVVSIGGSITLGVILGIPMAYLTGRILPGEPTLAEAMGFVLLSAGIAESFELVPILTAMAMGSTVASFAKHHDRPFHAIEGIEWPFMILFFVLAGASLEFVELRQVGAATAAYIVFRCIGTYGGARLGGRFANTTPAMRKWLGLALFPQAGVAIGMALLASQRFPDSAQFVLPITLASTILFEIFAPIVTRQALQAAAEPGTSERQGSAAD